ncbi:MAG: septal ring lytic transglycosylase RlpA family protein [Henriciella sp.]|nr:septal ring lytic transglycosylase RlpA family protein [Henriciella sp.]
MTVRFTRTLLPALASASAAVLLFAGTANADRRSAAPIVFGEQTGAPATQTYQRQYSASSHAPSATVQANPKSKRLEFRYPDQPDVYYGNDGPRTGQITDTPMAFSSSTAAIGSQAARQYAALPEPVMPEPEYSMDQAITPGGFDARAAAARVAERRANTIPQPIRVTATTPTVAQPVGRPLTLSRVNANQDATMSEETGKAGVYADGFEGRPTANGEIFDGSAMTAAHPTLPLPSLVQVINQSNGREIVVRVNDRGPFAGGRIMDLSERAADMLGIRGEQTANVRVRYLGPAPVKQVPQLAARAVQEDSLAAVVAAPVQSIAFKEPSLGVPDPVQTMQAPPVKVADGNVFIQAGSFADIGNAQRLTHALGRQLPVEIQEARVRNADYFRVMIGPFQTREQAEVYRAHLRQSGISDGLIVQQ